MSGQRQAAEPAGAEHQAKTERSPRLAAKSNSERISDSEQSTETNSLSAESNNDNGRSPVKLTPSGPDQTRRPKGKHRRRGADWEIIDGLKTPLPGDHVPAKLEGFLLKKRKWPLKGWHKVMPPRFCCLHSRPSNRSLFNRDSSYWKREA